MKVWKKRAGSLFLCIVLLITSCTWQSPSAEAAAGAMRNITSVQLVQEMGLGWNLGDTLDVCVADRDGDGEVNEEPVNGVVDETLWGNIRTTKALFQTLKSQGINSVRIPVTWRDHMGEAPNYTIDKAWMDRVQEVVDYAYSLGMYVIINVHHDGGGDPQFGAWIRDAAYNKETVLTRYQAVWKQIAMRFQNYSDHLIFESMNEVGFDDLEKEEAFSLLNEINQTFVDLVRGTGGNNAKRHLLIAGYWTDIAETCRSYFKMPQDSANHCILSLHYYTPWQFCTTNMQHTWGTEEDIQEMEGKIALLKENFTDRGIPVIIGEFGTGLGNDTASRILFCSEFVRRCKELGIPAFFWDNGGEFNRKTLKWRTAGLLKAMVKAAGVHSQTPAQRTPSPVITKKAELKKGQKATISGGMYRVTKGGISGKAEVTYLRPVKKNSKKIRIPATVQIKGIQCRVTSVQEKAFAGCKKLRQVTLGGNIKKIGKNSFYKCRKLKTVVIESDRIRFVGKKAFQKIAKKPVVKLPANKYKRYKKLLKISGKVKYRKQIRINCSKLTLNEGQKATLRLIGKSKKIKWSSAKKKVASVTAKGIVTARKQGSTKIIAKTGGKKYQCRVTVKKPAAVKTPAAPKPSVTPEPTPSARPSAEPARNKEDVTALKKIIQEKKEEGAWLVQDISDEDCYTWENGRLTEIFWGGCEITGTIDFSGLSELKNVVLEYNRIDQINISSNYKLESLNVSYNSVKSLSIGNPPALKYLSCYQNNLSELDLSGCVNLEYLDCSNNNLSALDVGKCLKLKNLDYGYTGLTSVDISKCNDLEYLVCSGNGIKLLDLSNNTKLQGLICSENQLESLDLSAVTKLTDLECSHCNLTELNINHLKNMMYVECSNNPLTSLDLSNMENLIYIFCNTCEIKELKLSNNKKLVGLGCTNNHIASLDLSGCPDISSIDCSNNQITGLNLSECRSLWELNCNNNQMTVLDVSECSSLCLVSCSGNQIESLDFTGMSELNSLDVSDNNLRNLNLSGCTEVYIADCSKNQLQSLDLSGCSGLCTFNCRDNQLISLTLEKESDLYLLNCLNNQLASLDVSGYESLENLYCDPEVVISGWSAPEKNADDVAALNAMIQTLRAQGADLEEDCLHSDRYRWEEGRLFVIDWSGCQIQGAVTISGLPNVYSLNLNSNQITSLDVSACEGLGSLECRDNLLTTLDLSANGWLEDWECDESVVVTEPEWSEW